MTTSASGGDATASPPDPPPPSSPPGHGGGDRPLSNRNPSGNRSDMTSGAPATMAATNATSLSQAAATQPSSGVEGMNQDVYVTGQSVVLSTQDSVEADMPQAEGLGASLASGLENGPPCCQPAQEYTNMEESSVESPTVIPSEPPVPLKSYQMKLVILKTKNLKDKVLKLIQMLMSRDDQMCIDPFHTCTPKTSHIIVVPGDVPKEDKYFARYFVDMHDNRNKEGTTLLFRIMSEHSQPCQMAINARN